MRKEQLLEHLRVKISGMFRVDTDDLGMSEARRLEKAEIAGYNQAISDVLDELHSVRSTPALRKRSVR